MKILFFLLLLIVVGLAVALCITAGLARAAFGLMDWITNASSGPDSSP